MAFRLVKESTCSLTSALAACIVSKYFACNQKYVFFFSDDHKGFTICHCLVKTFVMFSTFFLIISLFFLGINYTNN